MNNEMKVESEKQFRSSFYTCIWTFVFDQSLDLSISLVIRLRCICWTWSIQAKRQELIKYCDSQLTCRLSLCLRI